MHISENRGVSVESISGKKENKKSPSGGDASVTGGFAMWRQRVCEKALCLPLRLCCEPKTAFKKKLALGIPWWSGG